MKIIFTRHAREKFDVLKEHGFTVSQKQVLDAMKSPDLIDRSRLPLWIAQHRIDTDHVLRVVYKKLDDATIKVITFYPGRRRNYEKQ